jgi:WD40 repeat protein
LTVGLVNWGWSHAKYAAKAGLLGLLLFTCSCGKAHNGPFPKDEQVLPSVTRPEAATVRVAWLPPPEEDGVIFGFVFSPDGKQLVWKGSVKWKGQVRVWDLGARSYTKLLPTEGALAGLTFSQDGRYFAVGDEVAISLWEVQSWKLVRRCKEKLLAGCSLAFSPDSKLLAASGYREQTVLLDVSELAGLRPLPGKPHPYSGRHLTFSPDGKWLASTDFVSSIKVWSLTDLNQPWSLHAHIHPVTKRTGIQGAVFAPDSRTLITTGTDGMVRCWDVTQRREVAALKGNIGEVETLALTPDGSILAIGSGRMAVLRLDGGRAVDLGNIALWDWRKRREIARIRNLPAGVSCVRFSPDGKWLVASSAGPNGTFMAWSVAQLLKGKPSDPPAP